MSEPVACDLREQRCKPCEGGIAPHSLAESKELLKQLNASWVLSSDGKKIRRQCKFKNFYRTMSFVNAVAHIANSEDHHPDLEVGYDYCNITFTTHAIKGLSANDFICAAKVDAVPIS
jgi:4a-hydroxytetrahydrobiopterin dehydratase